MFGKIFTSDSFIYKFLAWPDNILYGAPKTICALRSAVILKLVLILAGITALLGYTSTVTYFLLVTITKWFPSFLGGIYVFNDFAKAGGVMVFFTGIALAIVAAIGAIIFATNWNDNRKYRLHEAALRSGVVTQPNAVVLMFTSWKDKICYPVSFKHPNQAEMGYDNDDYPHNGQAYVEPEPVKPRYTDGHDEEGYAFDATVGHPMRTGTSA